MSRDRDFVLTNWFKTYSEKLINARDFLLGNPEFPEVKVKMPYYDLEDYEIDWLTYELIDLLGGDFFISVNSKKKAAFLYEDASESIDYYFEPRERGINFDDAGNMYVDGELW